MKNTHYALLIRTQKILLHRHCEPKAKQSLNIGIASPPSADRNDNLVSAFVLVLSFLFGIVPLYAAQDNSYLVMDKSGNNVYMAWQEGTGAIWLNKSADKGISFGEELNASEGIGGINKNPAIAVDDAGNLYIKVVGFVKTTF